MDVYRDYQTTLGTPLIFSQQAPVIGPMSRVPWEVCVYCHQITVYLTPLPCYYFHGMVNSFN